jgi:hypothetical protein
LRWFPRPEVSGVITQLILETGRSAKLEELAFWFTPTSQLLKCCGLVQFENDASALLTILPIILGEQGSLDIKTLTALLTVRWCMREVASFRDSLLLELCGAQAVRGFISKES